MKDEIDLMNSNDNFSIYEEVDNSSGEATPIHKVWIDPIPKSCPKDNEFVNNIFYSNDRPVLQKFIRIPLTQVPGTSAFKADDYVDVITSKDYNVTLFDDEDSIVPYGLNRLEFHGDYITFKSGLPEGYKLPFSVSFVKYVGRKADNTLLRSDGEIKMDDIYYPVEPKDIATKEYVDRVDNVIDNLTPTLPPTLKDAKLYLQNSTHKGHIILTGQEYDFIIEDDEIIIKSDPFYNIGTGRLHLMVNDFELSTIGLNGLLETNGIITLEKIDSYADDPVANGFYTSYIATIKMNKDHFNPRLDGDNPILLIKLKQEHGLDLEYSQEIVLGIEKPITKIAIGSNGFDRFDGDYKYVSGVPSVSPDQKMYFSYRLNGLKRWMNPKLSKYIWYDNEVEIENEKTYDTMFPELVENIELSVPENSYSETIDLKLFAYNVLGEESTLDVQRPWRFDNVSDESKRLTSGLGMRPDIDTYGKGFNSRESLSKNEELQMLNGRYRWPSGDYSVTKGHSVLLDAILPPLPEGPNYNEIIPSLGVRWATFKYEITNANGIFVSLEDAEGLTMVDNITKETNWECTVKVEGTTGWLDGNAPYDGYGNPREHESPALVIYDSNLTKKYITFGNEPISGTLYVRIGLRKGGSSFKGVDITVNNK